MDPLRVVHFADLHLGVEAGGRANPATGLNQRIHDVCDRLDELCRCVEDEDVHLVLFAGDAFKHQHPTPTLQNLFAERMRRLARSGAAVFLLIGNHDLPKMAALAHPFAIYRALEIEGVVIGDRAQVYEVPLPASAPAPRVQIAALPHFSRQQVMARLAAQGDVPLDKLDEQINDAVDARVRELGGRIDASLPRLFCGHCHVNQAELSNAQSFFGVSELEITLSSLASSGPFPYFALGHVHKRQILSSDPHVAYSGSLERVDFSEGETIRVGTDGSVRRTAAEDKGFVRFDLDPKTFELVSDPEFRIVSARDFLTIRADVGGADDTTAAALDALTLARNAGARTDGAFVRFVIKMDATDRAGFIPRAVKDAMPEAYDVRVILDAADESMAVRDPRFATRMSESEALERYVETRQDWGADRAQILRAGRELIAEVLA